MTDVVHARKISRKSRVVSKYQKSRNQKAFTTVKSIVSMFSIMALLVFSFGFSPAAQAAVGDITVIDLSGPDTGPFNAYGVWETVGNQPCFNSGDGGFRYKIWVFEDLVPTTPPVFNNGTDPVLQIISPAPCDGGVFANGSGNIDSDDEAWPAVGQSADHDFNLSEGSHTICAVLLHVNDKGNDVVATDCVDHSIIVPGDTFPLDVVITGQGTVTSGIDGIDCESDCNEDYEEDTMVTLTADPADGWVFDGWGGACIDEETEVCVVTMDDAKSVTATFVENVGTLTITKTTVDGDGTFGFSYAEGTDDNFTITTDSGIGSQELTLTPGTYTITEISTPDTNWNQTDSDCIEVEVTLGGKASCTIENTYTAPQPDKGSLKVTKTTVGGDGTFGFSYTGGETADFNIITSAGTGDYTITNLTPGSYSITEVSTPGDKWSEDSNTCTNITVSANQTATCTITNTYTPVADLSVTKIVDDNTPDEGQSLVYTITVTNNGDDDATAVVVTDSIPLNLTYVLDDAANDADTTLVANNLTWAIGNLASGASTTLNVTVNVNSETAGSTIDNTAVVDANETDNNTDNNSSTASLTVNQGQGPQRYTLTVTTSGDGDGVVNGTDINCDSNSEENICSFVYDEGTKVDLTVTPDEGSNFDGTWSTTLGNPGTCTGASTSCTVTMNGKVTLNAHFGLNSSGGGSHHHSSGSSSGGQILGETTEVFPPAPTPVVQGATLPVTGASADLMIALMLAGVAPLFRKLNKDLNASK